MSFSLLNRSIRKTPPLRYFSTPFSSLAVLRAPPPPEHGPTSPPDPFRVFTAYASSNRFTLRSTRIVHAHLLKTGLLLSTVFVDNSLLDWYCKSGAFADAYFLFDEIPQRNVVSWNIMISGCNVGSLFWDSLGLFRRMWDSGFDPNEITYGCVLSACSATAATGFGRQVYSLAVKNGFVADGHVRSGMIDLFGKSGQFEDALRVFGDGLCENVVAWNTMISGAVKNGENRTALELFKMLCRESLVPNCFTFSSLLAACAVLGELEIGKGIHGWVIKCAANDVFVETAIVDLYAKCGDSSQAAKQFSRIPIHNVVSWTTMISCFVRNGDSVSALKIFKEMRRLRAAINDYTLSSVIAACANLESIKETIQVHGWIIKAGFSANPTVGAALINAYADMRAIHLSEMVFREFDGTNNLGIWAVMMSSYAHQQCVQRAIKLFVKMLRKGLRPDEFCYSTVFSVTDCINLGRQIHCRSLKAGVLFDTSVGSSAFTMYSKCGSIEDSYKVFKQIPVRDNVAWTSMIAGFAEHGHVQAAFSLLRDMVAEGTRPGNTCLVAALTACLSARSVRKTKEVHGFAFRAGFSQGALVGGAIVASYSKCGVLSLARKVYDMLLEKDQVSYSSLISGYAQHGLHEDAVTLFREMLRFGFTPDSYTMSSVVYAIAQLDMRYIGIPLHTLVIKMGLGSNASVGSSLVTMYSKCGSIEDCYRAFTLIHEPDLISWTTMISSYAQHGKGEEALRMYEEMRMKGIKPDVVTFAALLFACSHSNFVDEGYLYFKSMIKDFGLEPNNYHYACMVDLLGRSGRLKEAENLINSMPIKPDALVWNTLLAACKVHGEVELARLAARKVLELDPSDSGAYVSLSNVCAELGQWEEVLEIRSLMSGTGVKKVPGWSSM